VPEQTAISWCDATFNPWIGCAKVSPACARCYAETLAVNRMGLTEAKGTAVWGEGANRKVTADSTWKKPTRWNRLAVEGLLPDGSPNVDGHRPRVFCASMADVFEERRDLQETRDRLFDLIERTPALDWLLLTKRPEFARAWLYDFYARRGLREWASRDGIGWGVLPNVWVGVSVENSRWTWRADVLREIPAPVRFLSAEPLLGSLFDRPRLVACDCDEERHGGARHYVCPFCREYPDQCGCRQVRRPLDLAGIDWLIVGGESGGRASRPMHPAWARELRYAALDRGIAFHFKQFGSWGPAGSGVYPGDVCWSLAVDGYEEKYVADADYVCASNESIGEWIRYYGPAPKAGGKLLDGVEYCEFPSAAVPA